MSKKIELHEYAFYLKSISFVKRFGFVNQQIRITKDNLSLIYSNQDKIILKSISDISQGEINELFLMFGDLCRIGNQLHFNEFLREHFEHLDTLPLRICQELAKRGYDIFDLLKNNLAINFYSC